MQFPSFTAHSDQNALRFLAVCSIRRLLNRIHSTLYATGQRIDPANAATSPIVPRAPESPLTPSSFLSDANLDTVCTELMRQLKSWYESLPDEIRPDLDVQPARDLYDGVLRLRYWSAMHIIGRPFLVFVVMSPRRSNFPLHVMEYCNLCLDSCRRSIDMGSQLLAHRTPYTWMIIHS